MPCHWKHHCVCQHFNQNSGAYDGSAAHTLPYYTVLVQCGALSLGADYAQTIVDFIDHEHIHH